MLEKSLTYPCDTNVKSTNIYLSWFSSQYFWINYMCMCTYLCVCMCISKTYLYVFARTLQVYVIIMFVCAYHKKLHTYINFSHVRKYVHM